MSEWIDHKIIKDAVFESMLDHKAPFYSLCTLVSHSLYHSLAWLQAQASSYCSLTAWTGFCLRTFVLGVPVSNFQ